VLCVGCVTAIGMRFKVSTLVFKLCVFGFSYTAEDRRRRLHKRELDWVECSGGASAVKEPGHFEVRKSSSQVTRMHFFLKKVDDLFLLLPLW